MQVKTIIVDDESNISEHLQRLITTHIHQLSIVKIADNINDAYTSIIQHRPDLVLLDIQLPGANGFDLLLKFPQPDFEVIFVTAYDHYGIQAIKFSALDYLLKPVMLDDLLTAVEKAIKRISQKQKNSQLQNLLSFIAASSHEKKIALPLQDEIRYETIESILRLEASNNYSFVFLENGEKLLVCKTLKEFSAILESYGFIRTHQSHLINIRFIKSYLKEDGGTLLLANKIKIPVSKAHRSIVKEKLQQIF